MKRRPVTAPLRRGDGLSPWVERRCSECRGTRGRRLAAWQRGSVAEWLSGAVAEWAWGQSVAWGGRHCVPTHRSAAERDEMKAVAATCAAPRAHGRCLCHSATLSLRHRATSSLIPRTRNRARVDRAPEQGRTGSSPFNSPRSRPHSPTAPHPPQPVNDDPRLAPGVVPTHMMSRASLKARFVISPDGDAPRPGPRARAHRRRPAQG